MSDNNAMTTVWPRLLGSFTPREMTVRAWCEQQGVSEQINIIIGDDGSPRFPNPLQRRKRNGWP